LSADPRWALLSDDEMADYVRLRAMAANRERAGARWVREQAQRERCSEMEQ